jgi:hypothetical protein
MEPRSVTGNFEVPPRVDWRRRRMQQRMEEEERKGRINLLSVQHKDKQVQRQREIEQASAERNALRADFLSRAKFPMPHGAGGFFAVGQGGRLKTLGSGGGAADERVTEDFDHNLQLAKKRLMTSKVTQRLKLWQSDFKICPVCCERNITARDVVRGIVLRPGTEAVEVKELEGLPSADPPLYCGKTVFTCGACAWSTEFEYEDCSSPRYPETVHWRKLKTMSRTRSRSASPRRNNNDNLMTRTRSRSASPRRHEADILDVVGEQGSMPCSSELRLMRLFHSALPMRAAPAKQSFQESDTKQDAHGVETFPRGNCRQEMSEVERIPSSPASRETTNVGHLLQSNSFGILTATPCLPSPLDKVHRKSLSPCRVPKIFEDGTSVCPMCAQGKLST